MISMKNKLKSRSGASITFALLLFLVCAVISSVVIVAGTTAAGRMSQAAQMDQRYYAVTSAAELLKSEIDGKEVIVTSETKAAEDGTSTTEYTAKYSDAGESEDSEAPDTILTDASKALIPLLNTTENAPEKSFKLEADGQPALACDIKETVQYNGLLRFDISNANGQKYTLRIVFAPNIKRSATGDRTTLTWKFHSMKKIRDNSEPGI